jgi:hypothetical protein
MLFPAVSYLHSLKMVCTVNRSLCFILMGNQIYIISSIVLETVIAVKIKSIHEKLAFVVEYFRKSTILQSW